MTWRCAALAVWLCAAHAIAGPEKRHYTFTHEHDFATHEHLVVELYNPSGQVNIHRATTDTLRVVEKIVIPATDSTYAMMFLDEAVVTYQRQQDRIVVAALVRRPPQKQAAFGGPLNLRLQTRAVVDFEIFLPSGVELEVGTAGGAIHAHRTASPMKLTSKGGEIAVQRATGDISAGTATGAIEMANCTATCNVTSGAGDVTAIESQGTLTGITHTGRITVRDWLGDVRLESGQGNIAALRVKGTLTCNTRSGDCLIEGHAGDVFLESSSGDVTLTGFPQGHDVQIVTISGHITGQLNESMPKRMSARSRRGTIVSDLSLEGMDVSTRHVTGDRESGSGRLYLETTEGRIRLK